MAGIVATIERILSQLANVLTSASDVLSQLLSVFAQLRELTSAAPKPLAA